MAYQSKFYGREIDEAVEAVRNNATIWTGKQEKLVGSQGLVVGFDAAGNAVAQGTSDLVGPQGPAGPPGATGPQGSAGADGEDGFSPTVTVTDITGGHQVTITDASGPHTFDVMDGRDGTGGGASGVTSFNGRSGEVQPATGDYTASMVGARPDTWMPSAAEVGAATMEQITAAIQSAVLDSWEGSY